MDVLTMRSRKKSRYLKTNENKKQLWDIAKAVLRGKFIVKQAYLDFIDFLQRGRERDRELEASMKENHRSAASCTISTGDVPATKVHALDRN